MTSLVNSADSHVLEPADLWRYPHLEGTYPNTQAVLADIFDGVPETTRDAITRDNFARLFTVPAQP
jgi:hypothetical protein